MTCQARHVYYQLNKTVLPLSDYVDIIHTLMSSQALIPQSPQEVYNHQAPRPIYTPNIFNATTLIYYHPSCQPLRWVGFIEAYSRRLRGSILYDDLAECFHNGVADKVPLYFKVQQTWRLGFTPFCL